MHTHTFLNGKIKVFSGQLRQETNTYIATIWNLRQALLDFLAREGQPHVTLQFCQIWVQLWWEGRDKVSLSSWCRADFGWPGSSILSESGILQEHSDPLEHVVCPRDACQWHGPALPEA